MRLRGGGICLCRRNRGPQARAQSGRGPPPAPQNQKTQKNQKPKKKIGNMRSQKQLQNRDAGAAPSGPRSPTLRQIRAQ